ncbi:MAG: PhoH family protein [Clostridia bacterium]|nr:PhoH family protein [Clostridia bacterium]
MTRQIEIPEGSDLSALFGSFDANVKLLEKSLNVKLTGRDGTIKLTGSEDDVDKADEVLAILLQIIDRGERIDEQKILYAVTMVQENGGFDLKLLGDDCIAVNQRGNPIKTKTLGQKKYVESMRENTIVFGIGPAGTGKTYLAVARAVTALRNKEVARIILTRPAVEAGEKLGFLPGDLQNKVDPYLRPLYDGMFEMLGAELFAKYQEKGMIEVAPLAYMRGRTLDNAFIILDEAQNTTPEQMKMFLTRIGFGSKAVVTGDITQIDLPGGKASGLKEAMRVLKGVEDISFSILTEKDVVRHPLVQKIIKAYEKYDNEQEKRKKNDKTAHRERTGERRINRRD